MDRFRGVVIGLGVVIVLVIAIGLSRIVMPGTPAKPQAAANEYKGAVSASALLRVPVSGIYPGGNAAGLNPNMKNPLADDPDAVERGMKDFTVFNCSGCHMANGGGGMGPALSNSTWIYRSSPANIYLDIAQGRAAGMPAFGAMLPDRTIWELVAYIQSISKDPGDTFGTTTSAEPQSPNTEQVPANQLKSATPWKFTEPMPKNGDKPG
ncbi:MAG: cytochrome c [Proteobacteria bacterium]|nr:cytochrome c [Pseudomonadota bacterium]